MVKVKIEVTGIGNDDTLEIRMVLERVKNLVRELVYNYVEVDYTNDDLSVRES